MKEELKNKIICGFAGIGKSYLAKNKEAIKKLEALTPKELNEEFDELYVRDTVQELSSDNYMLKKLSQSLLAKGQKENNE